jgi:hypothetical protein
MGLVTMRRKNISDSSSRKSPSKLDISHAASVRVGGFSLPRLEAASMRVEPSKSVMYPSNEKDVKSIVKSTDNKAPLLFSFMSASLACSADEILFVKLVQDNGLTQAIRIAARFDLRCLRPLQELLSRTDARGRSYTKRSARRKPLSNSPASLRKRS